MALSTGNTAIWSDIQSLYTRLNTERTRFGFSTVTVPGNPGTMVPKNISDLNTKVNEMSSNGYLTSVAITNVTVPSSGTLIKANPYTQISDTITKISGVCPFCSWGDFSCDGFCSWGDFSCNGYCSWGDNSCFGYCSWGDNSCVSFCSWGNNSNNPFCSFQGCGGSGFKSGGLKCDDLMIKEYLKYGVQFG